MRIWVGKGKTWEFLILVGLCGLFLLPATPLAAEAVYPSKNISWIIPFKPGGGHDLTARAIAPSLQKNMKKASPKSKGGVIVIKNEATGAGEKAIQILMIAPADGYTIGSLTGAFLAERFLEKKDYDVAKLTYLMRLDEMTRLLVTRKAGPKDWKEVLALSKTTPIKWGVGAFGRDLHVTSIIMNDKFGVSARFIPFGSTAENMNALLRGDIHIATISDDSAKTLLDAGEIRPLVYFDHKSIYPGVPSIQDLGHPELVDPTKGNRFLVGPPGLPKGLATMIVDTFLNASKEEEFVAWCKRTGFEFNLIYGDNLAKMVKGLLDFYEEKAPLIKKGIS